MRTKLAAAALATALGVCGLALTPSASAAAPATVSPAAAPLFNVTGTWLIYQTNATVSITVQQYSDGSLQGTTHSGSTNGTILYGSVDGNDIFFLVAWDYGGLGRYTGTRGPDFRLSGQTFDINHPTVQAAWHTAAWF